MIKIDNLAIVKYCKREHSMQAKVYPGLIKNKKMNEYQANQNYCIITELQEIAETLERKGYKWHELKKIVNDLPRLRTEAQQQKMRL